MDSKKLGEALQSRRKSLGLTQRELAMTAGTGSRFIVDLEAGKSTCQIGKVLRVIALLGLSIELRRRDEPPGTRIPK